MNAAKFLSAPATHARAAFALLRSPGATLAALEQVWHMVVLGGLLVRTPDSDQALIATTLQLDGDMVVKVRSCMLDAGEAERAALLDQHRQDLRAATACLAPLGRGIKAIRAITLAVPTGLLALPLGDAAFLRGQLMRHLASLLPAAFGFLFHMSVPRLGRLILRSRLAPVRLEWRKASEGAHGRMIARRKQGAGA